MIQYIKRIKDGKIVGIGYVNFEEMDVMIEMFIECNDFSQEIIENSEFIKLAVIHNFIGLKPNYGEVPLSSSHF